MITKLERKNVSSDRDPLNPNYVWKELEEQVRVFSESVNLKEQVRKKLARKRPIGYVEGPPTLNNEPHVGHIRGRMMKDLWYRYNTLKGVNIVFRGGWDTQGLPIELQAEKELGVSGNKWEVLKQVGEEKLVEACKNLIQKYEEAWLESDRLLGLLLDHERSYKTYRDEYIEREWKYLETAWKKGLLGEGLKVVPYCPNCMTALSHAEVALGGYEPLDDPSLYYKVRTEGGPYLVVWTTMPFTVVTDELVGVNPLANYLFVRVGDETWIVGEERKEALEKEVGVKFGKILKRVTGKQLDGMKYDHPLLDMIPGLDKLNKEGNIHRVVAENFVDTTTGTGLVHISPANGEEDYAVASKRRLPVFAPFDDRLYFDAEAGRFGGLFVRDADRAVSVALRDAGHLVFEGRIVHDYPVCWRSGHRLIWVVRREYFYWIDRIRDELIEAAEKVQYFFDPPRNRFQEFIRESPPWGITRERLWGTPLPVWVCSKCNEKTPAFSRARILELAVALPDGADFELHRPWIDRVVLKCPKCGSKAYREQFVLDTWHNSGSAPYASFTDLEYEKLVPVQFLTEALDQTRGWAYALLVLNVLLRGKPISPYRSFLFQGFILDSQGRKMSKSLGNVIGGLQMLRENPVDLVRFYILWKSSPIDSWNWDMKEMTGRPYQVLNTLYHLHVYLSQNGELDGYRPEKHSLLWARDRKLLVTVDRWLLSKLARTESAVLEGYETGRFNEACRALDEFIIETLSQNYVRMVRGEIWQDTPEERDRRLAIYATLGYALQRVNVLLHPASPYVTEYLHQELFAGRAPWKTPLLVRGFGKPAARLTDKRAEALVEAALLVEAACNSARVKAKLKRRWPLGRAVVLVSEERRATMFKARELAKNLCNVKEVTVTSDPQSFPATLTLRPDSSKVGALFKERTREVLAKAGVLTGSRAWRRHVSSKSVSLRLRSGRFELPASVFKLDFAPRGDLEVVEKNGVLVAIERKRDEQLVAEGLVRDVARRLQALRKSKRFSPTEVLAEARVGGLEEDDLKMLLPFRKELSFLVRVKKVQLSSDKPTGTGSTEDELDGKTIFLDVH